MKLKFLKGFIKSNKRFYFSLIICCAICFSVFVTFNYLESSIEYGLNDYLLNYKYYDGMVQPFLGYFDNEDIDAITNVEEISYIKKANLYDSKIMDDTTYHYLRLIGIDLSDYDFYYIDEVPDGDVYLSAEFAKLNDYNAGDNINVQINDEKVSLKIKAIINNPEIMGAMRNVAVPLEQSSLGFAYIEESLLSKYTGNYSYNTVTYYLKDNADSKTASDRVKSIFEGRNFYFEENDSLVAKKSIESDLQVLNPIVKSLPLIVYAIGLIIAILFIRQFIGIKLKDIGILKASGCSNYYIMSLFINYVLSISFFGILLGVALTQIQSAIYVKFYTSSVFLPNFAIIKNYESIIFAALISSVINCLAVFLNINNIKKIDVLDVINNNLDVRNKSIGVLNNKMVRIKPFLATIINNPIRFILSLLNLILVVIIITASVGVKCFKDSSIKYMYEDEVNYDYIIHYHTYSTIPNNNDNAFKEKIIEVNDDYSEKLFVLNNLDYLNLRDIHNKKISLQNGILVSNKLAEKLDLQVDDYIKVNGKNVLVSGIVKEISDYKSYMSFETYKLLFNDNSCNAYFVKDSLDNYNLNDDNIYYITSIDSLQKDINNKFEYISRYILIIVFISAFICIIVIFNMSVVYYNERFKEHKILRTLGYSKFRIICYSLIDVVIESIIGLFVGLPFGYLLGDYVIKKINNDSITMYASFNDIPILVISIFIIIVAVVGRIIASRKQICLVDKE